MLQRACQFHIVAPFAIVASSTNLAGTDLQREIHLAWTIPSWKNVPAPPLLHLGLNFENGVGLLAKMEAVPHTNTSAVSPNALIV